MMQKDKNVKYEIKYRAEFVNLFVSVSLFATALALAFVFSPMISEDVKAGLVLCYTAIIPSVFPFMILADLMLTYMHFEKIGALRKLFSKVFKINGYAITAFLSGLICGFPVGIKISKELYLSGKITKNECERLIGFSNNASPAFVISGIGYGLLGSVKTGILLYIISIISSVLIGILYSFNESSSYEDYYNGDIPYSFTKSIKEASEATLNVCGFITFFSVIIGFFEKAVKNELLITLISSFLEIGNATRLISTNLSFPYEISVALLAFSISFSGLSVHLQSKSILNDTDISMKKYYVMKLLSGFLSAAIAFIVISI